MLSFFSKLILFIRSFFIPKNKKDKYDRRIEVVKESSTGKNLKFRDKQTGVVYTLEQMRELVLKDEYPSYLVDRNGVIKSKVGVENLG